ncbi:nuclear matrix constituent protein 1 [Rhodamnia argentea]|uniref:Nuclear matrix constituent protein 1 n=1 Tax=Rhodamnia argentea TaxID=178133 RepID=A0A8B8MNZ7_9MYRT|nr:nuclear matrix constituent protein 1 [Rhodamnia argentea]
MFTPQRKVWSGWTLTPPSQAPKSGSGSGPNPSADGKGKSIVPAEPVTPLLGSNGMVVEGGDSVDKVSLLEKELFEYQYNMGLLLIEKKEWASKHEELRRALEEIKDALKREQTAHLIAMSDVEKREDDLRKALGVEKQCVTDLEKALREMRAEYAEIKFTADSKLAEANALAASIEEKSLEVEAKLHAADAKLAEISRKNSEIARKSQDVDAREASFRRERLSFITEREVHETTLSKQREDLQEWERKLRDGEERLGDRLRVLNQREEMANEKDKIYKQKEKDLEGAQKTIEEGNLTLSRKEEDMSTRLANLKLKEKEFETLRKNLEIKEKQLVATEEKLNARERDEIQKLVDEHARVLDVKKDEFELELEQKRKKFDEDLERKGFDVQKKEAEIKHKEDKLVKREQAVDKKNEKLKEKEDDLQLKLKDLKEREKSLKSEENNLETQKKSVAVEKEELLSFRAALERVRVENEEQLVKIRMEKDQLKVSEEERSEFVHLQSELKEERETCRLHKELLLKEAEDLKQQKEAFEKEWDELDEKRTQIEKERMDAERQKEKFEKLKHSEEEKLQRDKMETNEYIKRELEDLKLAKGSFEARMEHETSVLAEKVQSERSQMLRDFELQKKELETNMQNKWDEMENNLHRRIKSFEEEKERELNNINYLREVARREMEEMKQERAELQKEREEFAANKKHLEDEQVEIRKDINQLVALSKKLKDQREKFIEERDRFISFAKQQSSCNTCGELTREFLLSDLQCISEIENAELSQSKLAEGYVKEEANMTFNASGRPNTDTSPNLVGSRTPLSTGTVSWLRKCTSKIFSFSPGRKTDSHPVQDLTREGHVHGDHVNVEEPSKAYTENDAELSFAATSASCDVEGHQREDEAGQDISYDSNVNSKRQEVAEDSQPSDLNNGVHQPRRRGRTRVNRTRTMKEVVKDAKTILGKGFGSNETEQENGNAEDSAPTNADSRDEPSLADEGRPRNLRKRGRDNTTVSEHDADDTEGHSDSVRLGQRGKRRQRNAGAVQAMGERRYNLRRPKGGVKTTASGVSNDLNKDKKKEAGREVVEEEIHYAKAVPAFSVTVASGNGGNTHFVRCGSLADTQDGDANGTKEIVEDMALSEEVNGTPDKGDKHGNRSESLGVDAVALDEDGDDDECEDEHPGEVSMGKKLWNFLTT